jgi:hypothetical protein
MRGGVIDPAWRIYVDKPRGRPAATTAADSVFVPAMPKIEEVFAEAFGGCERVLICADAAAPLAADGLLLLGDVVRRSGAQPGAVVFFDPKDDRLDSHSRAATAVTTARTLAESGRFAPFVAIDLTRASQLTDPAGPDPMLGILDSVSGALDLVLRLPRMPSFGPSLDSSAVTAHLLAKGWSTIGLAATREVGREALDAVVARALGQGLMAQAMPPSRARTVFVCTIVGAGLSGEVEPGAARATMARLLPQAQRLEATYLDAEESVRVIAWVGGLPYPESFFPERAAGV